MQLCTTYKISVLFFCFISMSCRAVDNAHFYRATLYEGEPRLAIPWFSSFDAAIGRGSTTSGNNARGKKVPLLDIYGVQNMQFLGAGIPLNPANPFDQILIELQELPERPGFGELSFSGKFKIIEAPLCLYQNFTNGFFLEGYIPIRKLSTKNISFIDLSPTDSMIPNASTPVWQSFLQNLPAILQQFDLSITNVSEAGVGDLSLLLGWAWNNVRTVHLDYVDVDAKIGVLIPTGRQRNENKPFDLPLGYNGHWGVPLRFDGALGAFDWFTCGLSLDAVFFFNKTKTVRVQSSNQQSGFIKLAQEKVTVDQGTIWNICSYVKADHVAKGFSLWLGYTFSQQDATCLSLELASSLNKTLINRDEQLQQWSMHVLHCIAEYDFAKTERDWGPRLGFSYNHILAGKRIFLTDMIFGYIGIDINWCF